VFAISTLTLITPTGANTGLSRLNANGHQSSCDSVARRHRVITKPIISALIDIATRFKTFAPVKAMVAGASVGVVGTLSIETPATLTIPVANAGWLF
jgi:hypothetical protein